MAKSPPPIAPTRRIRLVADHLIAVGPYRHGQDYEVPTELAARLVGHRGFVYVDDAPVPAPDNSLQTTHTEDTL